MTKVIVDCVDCDSMTKETNEPKITGWIMTHDPSGKVLHFSVRDGWTFEIVTVQE